MLEPADARTTTWKPAAEWEQLLRAAHAAGKWAAGELARRCSSRHLLLGRAGTVSVLIGAAESPVAAWLLERGQGWLRGEHVAVPITVDPRDLHPAADAAEKACSLLVAHAYAAAYSTVLVQEAGVDADVAVEPAPNQPSA
ncbi:hypothetical protein GCM10027174_03270 [Salinifilum aidingensis]